MQGAWAHEVENSKIHKYRSLSRKSCDHGRIDDTDGNRVAKRKSQNSTRLSAAQPQRWAWRAWPETAGLHWKLVRYLDVACRYDDWVQGGCDTWIPSCCGRREFSTCGRQRFGKFQGSAMKQTSRRNFETEKKIQEIMQHMFTHHTMGRSQWALKAAVDGLSRVDSCK